MVILNSYGNHLPLTVSVCSEWSFSHLKNAYVCMYVCTSHRGVLCYSGCCRPDQNNTQEYTSPVASWNFPLLHTGPDLLTILLSVTVWRGRRNRAQPDYNVGHSIYNSAEKASSLSAANLCTSVRMTRPIIFEETDYRKGERGTDSYCEEWKPSSEWRSPESDLKYKSGQN